MDKLEILKRVTNAAEVTSLHQMLYFLASLSSLLLYVFVTYFRVTRQIILFISLYIIWYPSFDKLFIYLNSVLFCNSLFWSNCIALYCIGCIILIMAPVTNDLPPTPVCRLNTSSVRINCNTVQ